MTVGELIAELSKVDDLELEVLLYNEENNSMEPITSVNEVRVPHSINDTVLVLSNGE